MTESLADIDARLKEAQQKAIELQQQREMLRQEQIDKMRDESLKAEKAEAERIHNEMTVKEREALDKYVENLPERLVKFMDEQRAQRNGQNFTLEGWRPPPILLPAQEAKLLNDSIALIENGQQRNVETQTKDLQQEWNAVTQKALEQQAEIDRLKTAQERQQQEKSLNNYGQSRQSNRDYSSLPQPESKQEFLHGITGVERGREIPEQEYLKSPDARKEWRAQQDIKEQRTAALDSMKLYKKNGLDIDLNKCDHLYRDEVDKIRKNGMEELNELLRQREQELERQKQQQREMTRR
jgi:hypothetical protein